jgi:hypothetical protein
MQRLFVQLINISLLFPGKVCGFNVIYFGSGDFIRVLHNIKMLGQKCYFKTIKIDSLVDHTFFYQSKRMIEESYNKCKKSLMIYKRERERERELS